VPRLDPTSAASRDNALGGLPPDRLWLPLVRSTGRRSGVRPKVRRGPRTIEHLDGYLASDGIDLSDDVLDRIDEIVPPGVTINVADNMWDFGTTALTAAFRRR
jgi:hypothetical protein